MGFPRLSFGPVALTFRGEARRDAPGPWKPQFLLKQGSKTRLFYLFGVSAGVIFQREQPGLPSVRHPQSADLNWADFRKRKRENMISDFSGFSIPVLITIEVSRARERHDELRLEKLV